MTCKVTLVTFLGLLFAVPCVTSKHLLDLMNSYNGCIYVALSHFEFFYVS